MDEKLWFMEVRRGDGGLPRVFYDQGARATPGHMPSWFTVPGRPAPDEAAARQEAAVYLRGTGDPVPAGEVPSMDELVAMSDADFNRWQIRAGKAAGAIEFRDHAQASGRAWLFFGCTVDTDFPAGTL
jgi:hypothetical protein